MTPLRFRLLLSLYLAVSVATLITPFMLPDALSPAMQAAVENEPEPLIYANPALSLALLLPGAVAIVAGIIGMFMFKPWSRTFALWGTIAIIPLIFFCGVSVYSELENALLEVNSILWGAVLAIAYYSPVSTHFDKPSRNSNEDHLPK